MPSQITISREHFRYDYHSGNGVGIYIGAYQITDAIGIEFDLMQTKRPVWGYASSLYDGVASGIVQVSGTIYMNFTQAQQMSTFVANSAGTVGLADLNNKGSIEDLGFNNSMDITGIDGYATHLKHKYWSNPRYMGVEGQNVSIKRDGAFVAHARPDQHLEGFDIVITYGVPFQDTEHTHSTLRVVRGARVLGFGQVISPDGEPIIERYSFLAREVI